jgi:hypothetical protein
VQDLIDFLGTYGHGHGIAARSVQDARGLTRHPQPPCFILAARGPRFRNNRNVFSHF